MTRADVSQDATRQHLMAQREALVQEMANLTGAWYGSGYPNSPLIFPDAEGLENRTVLVYHPLGMGACLLRLTSVIIVRC